MSERDQKLLLEDMLESAQRIKKYTLGLDFESFVSDDKTIDAVVRNFEVIGEAANRIHPDFKLENAHVEWDRLRGFRNRIVHAYFGIDYEIVWSIIENNLDDLLDKLTELLEK